MGSVLFSFLLLLLPFSLFMACVRGNAEVRALMEVKSALDPEERVLGSWTIGGDPCRGAGFEGVACNEHGKVANISLQGRGLSGSISPAIAGLRSLSGLYLHYNALRGEIPTEIGNLSELTDLYLSVNNLSGSIPAEIANIGNLQVLQLCYNQLTGSLPTQLGLLKNLSVLALQSNQLTGAIPASLGDLTLLMRLDLSFNRLFGSIPTKFAQVPLLTVLDLRNNSLSGNVPSGLQRLSAGFQYGNNTGLCGVGFYSLETCSSDDAVKPDKPEPYGPNSANAKPQQIPRSANINVHCYNSHCPKPSQSSAGAVLVGVVVVAVGMAVLSLFAFLWHRRRKQRIGSSLEVSDCRASTDQKKESYRKCASPLIKLEYSNGWDPIADVACPSLRFNLEEVEFATQYFSEANLLGKSSLATTHKGVLRDGSMVAVKRINKTSCKAEEADFLKGLKVITSLRHDNLVCLRGFCYSRARGVCFLVYDFMANGSLLQYLDSKDGGERHRVLDWNARVSIVKGIAKGIEYLHACKPSKPSLVHQNISAEKILIDHDFTPRLSGAGLHKLLADDAVFSTLKASAAMGYLAPEYTTTGRFTEKSDVYAFGVVVLQVLTGKKTVSPPLRFGAEFVKPEELIDGSLGGNFSKPEAAKLVAMALLCTSEFPSQRPTMEAVVQQLSSSSSCGC